MLLLAFNRSIAQDKPIIKSDSLAVKDSILVDTLKTGSANDLNSEVKYSAEDSIFVDAKNSLVYLYGKGRIIYEDFELDADYIRLDQKNKLVFARGMQDATGKYKGRPLFKSGSEPPAATDSLTYNFETKKGIIYSIDTEVEGGYIHGGTAKKNQYDEISLEDNLYSTCNLPGLHKHFGIHITKGIITEKQIVTGPAYLVIENVPFPIAVPFGFFPKTNRRASGILFPTFGEDGARGFFMRDAGYYIALNDYVDAEARGTLYSKGSYEASLLSRYKRNYKFDGQVNLRYALTRTGVEGTDEYKPSKDFNIQWTHSQRAESNPGTTFSASVNVGTGRYFSRTAAGGTYDINQLTRNSLTSSIAYGKVFANGLFNFTSSLSHNQDIEKGTIFLQLPQASLNMTTLNPFDSKDRVGEQKWYQRISVGYSLQASNSISTTESLLFKKESLSKFNNGLQHNIPISLSLNVLNVLQFNSGVQYNERWYFQTIRKNFSTASNSVLTDTVRGFRRANEYSLSTGFSTKLYGMKTFKGKVMAIRHVVTPAVSVNYRPDFGQEKYGYYKTITNDPSAIKQKYSIFESGIYGSPGAGKSAGIGFSVDNSIEAKVRTKGDSVNSFKKVPILQGLSFTGNYNFVADSFKLSTISFGGRTAFFNQKLGLNFNGTFDPYRLNRFGQRVNEFAINDGKIARLTYIGFSMDFSFNSAAAKNRNDKLNQLGENRSAMTQNQMDELAKISRDPNAFVDFTIPWNITASYSFNYSKNGLLTSVTNTVNFSGDFSVTPKWKVVYTSGYDFRSSKISLTQFSILRDLHCWDMAFRWVPFGQYRSYSVDIRVKASILQDLKLSRRRDYFNNY